MSTTGTGQGEAGGVAGSTSESADPGLVRAADDSVISGHGEEAGASTQSSSELSAETSDGIHAEAGAAGTSNGLPEGSENGPNNGMEHFERLQRRLLFATACAVATAVPITGLLFDGNTALSLLLGGLAGLLYLRLLARSVSRLGGDRRSVGKFQLVVPVVLVLAAARIPALEILPALLGFLLYKPALLLQALLDR